MRVLWAGAQRSVLQLELFSSHAAVLEEKESHLAWEKHSSTSSPGGLDKSFLLALHEDADLLLGVLPELWELRRCRVDTGK